MKNTIAKVAKVGAATVSALVLSTQVVMAQAVTGSTGQTSGNVGTTIAPGTGFAANIGSIINFALQVVMVVALLLVFGFLVIGGIEWITSGGEKAKTESARNKITSAVIGLIVLAASYAILTLLLRFLGFTDINSAINGVKPINQQ